MEIVKMATYLYTARHMAGARRGVRNKVERTKVRVRESGPLGLRALRIGPCSAQCPVHGGVGLLSIR